MTQLDTEVENWADLKLPTELAYEQLLPEITALPEEELVTINIDVMNAVTTVTGCLPEIRALRPEIEAEWRRFDFERFDKLEQYTLALAHAQALYRSATQPKGIITELANQAAQIRDQLLGSAQMLASHGLVDGERLSQVKTATGYRALAGDVLTLCALFREQWAALEGKTPYVAADFKKAAQLALDLISAVGLREQSPAQVGAVTLNRQKAFSLFINAYDDARRAVHYLRAKAGDAESVAPSLYAGRARRRAGDERGEEARDDVAESSAPPAQTSAPAAPTAVPINNRAGLPVDAPFTS